MAYSSIDDPTIFFNTVLFTGNGSTNNITGVGFQPDWVWIKNRSSSKDHNIFDVVRGVNKKLESNTGIAESTLGGGLQAFGTDGFTLGDHDELNDNGDSHVSWNWKAGGSASSNSNGSITSSVSANTDAGFSIVSYTGNSTSGATVGHGLSSAPKFVIGKAINTSGEDWFTGNASNGFDKYIKLNDTHAVQTFSGVFNDTAPSSTVVTLGSNGIANSSSYNYIMYCFAEVKGYSKIGGYTGNGSTDGTFVYTGFKPALLLVKGTSGTNFWYLYDNKRDPNNVIENKLEANSNAADYTSVDWLDFTSNGFKWRYGSDKNASSSPYIYLAFAESPFVNSNGIPNNAR